jgi:hypothetical protein
VRAFRDPIVCFGPCSPTTAPATARHSPAGVAVIRWKWTLASAGDVPGLALGQRQIVIVDHYPVTHAKQNERVRHSRADTSGPTTATVDRA